MEWWDAELLPTKLKKSLATKEGEALARKTKLRMSLNHHKHTNEDAKATDAKSTNDDDQQQEEETERQALVERCFQAASLDHVKTAKLVQHPVPVHGPRDPQTATTSSTQQQQQRTLTLHLTKKERKKQRKLRRGEKLRDIQDLQAAGLIPAPEPRLTLSNFMKVLGDQAVMDPSQMEAKVNQQIQARRLKHEQMNEERKLTKEQKKDKRARKLAETDTQALSVALFLVKDMSHRYHRTKVDLNAQQNSITGGVLECENPNLALVIAEGGPKAMKRYIRLMTVRMKWKGENSGDNDMASDDDEPPESTMNTSNTDGTNEETAAAAPQKFNSDNSCELVWTGMAVKRMFHSFVFQSCASSEVARKVLEAKGVAHYWDQVLAHAKGQGESFQLFRLGGGTDDHPYSAKQNDESDNDIVMRD
jgi:U4/U6 small nuclear ribonucleoprotein PRP3